MSMRPVFKTLLLVEVVACFGPMTAMLMMGALLLPIQLISLFIEPLLWEGPVEVITMVLCGSVGLVTLLFLLDKLFDETATIERAWLVFVGAFIGAAPLIEPLTSPTVAWRILGAMPIIAGVHILYLSRRMLGGSAAKR
jgi:hypothetical protein